MTLEILGDSHAAARISETLAALGRGEPGADLAAVRQGLARRRATAGDHPGWGAVRHPLPTRRPACHLRVAARVRRRRGPEFSVAALAVNPQRAGQPLFGPLAGCHGARRGTRRIVYRIDEASRTVHVLDVDHRSDIYHQPNA